MKTNVEIELKPFDVPNSVMENRTEYPAPAAPAIPPSAAPAPVPVTPEWSDPYISPRQFKLSELSSEALDKLCDDFRNEVFKRAKKEQPPKPCCGEC